ncbi:PTS system mannose/fructose/sorbose family transporter subunit IID [Eubacterium multiforme]|uniref:Mannose/fructose/sorbose-specific phosphotransferase system IID component n=1 Tax=Eubacterium multiforme TaxID=83339 RepID=A0ABT9UPL9_9FIRM|nr:PTS system mannose/fructose/sorbose family transporter subunit IID [Eubacterium multiforme]MDQ0148599.1 mannose/fructose/sorbose-specific phosphotransferase system IID component [Eubacterium multiforme]
MIKNNISKEDKKLMNKVLLRSFTLECSFNYEKMQALGFAYSMIPVIKKFYKTKEERAKALTRHMGFFNTTPQVSPFIMGIASAMEKKNAEKGGVDDSSINGIKVGLMGPLAGIGDSFFWGTFRVIAAGVGIQFAQQGSILGAILFLILFNIPHLLVRYFGVQLGFGFGTKILESAYENGIMDKISKMATIVGLMVVGGMTFSMVKFSTPFVLVIGETKLELQNIFNQILPGVLPLLLTLFCFKSLKKGTKVNLLLLLMIILGILGKVVGIL